MKRWAALPENSFFYAVMVATVISVISSQGIDVTNLAAVLAAAGLPSVSLFKEHSATSRGDLVARLSAIQSGGLGRRFRNLGNGSRDRFVLDGYRYFR